jgi:hypothetical protein
LALVALVQLMGRVIGATLVEILCLIHSLLLAAAAADLMFIMPMAHNMVLLVVRVAVVDLLVPPKEMVVLEHLDKVMLVVLPHTLAQTHIQHRVEVVLVQLDKVHSLRVFLDMVELDYKTILTELIIIGLVAVEVVHKVVALYQETVDSVAVAVVLFTLQALLEQVVVLL